MEGLQVSARRAALGLAGGALLAAACYQPAPGSPPPPKHLVEGSLGQVMSLGYDEARVMVTAQDLSLLFVRVLPLATLPDAGGKEVGTLENYPLKLTYTPADGGMPAKVRVDLTELAGNGRQRGLFSRDVQDDPRKALPALLRGELYFDGPLAPDVNGALPVVHGDFHGTFLNGIEPASGHTVFGTFDAKVVVP